MLSPSLHSATDGTLGFNRKSVKKALKAENRRKSLVLEFVRVGHTPSFNDSIKRSDSFSCKKVINENMRERSSSRAMLDYCLSKLKSEPQLIGRNFLKLEKSSESDEISVMQWNILSQALGTYHDRFETCTTDEISWSKRRWKIIAEVLNYMPIDVICMQEVDCFDFLMEIMSKLGYGGIFGHKPDSPCNYIHNNSGPDGCAIFWKLDRLELIKSSKRILRVYKYHTNQVVLCCQFRHKSTSNELFVATTHLKARKGPILSAFRNEQGKNLLKYLLKKSKNIPLILTGDFNAEPYEPVYKSITNKLSSAYRDGLNCEPLYTTWTKREGEVELKRTLDYIFYTNHQLKVVSLLATDSENIVKPIPNPQYPSDHFSLVTRFNFITD